MMNELPRNIAIVFVFMLTIILTLYALKERLTVSHKQARIKQIDREMGDLRRRLEITAGWIERFQIEKMELQDTNISAWAEARHITSGASILYHACIEDLRYTLAALDGDILEYTIRIATLRVERMRLEEDVRW